jgi:hypothetical protein
MGAGMNNGLLHAGIVAALIGRTRTHHHTSYDALPVEDELTIRVVVRLKDRRLENHRRVPGPQLAGRANCPLAPIPIAAFEGIVESIAPGRTGRHDRPISQNEPDGDTPIGPEPVPA